MACGQDPYIRGGSSGHKVRMGKPAFGKAGCSVACLEWWRRISQGNHMTPARVLWFALKPDTAKEARN